MCELFQAWLEESINNIINIVFQNENKESNIENIIKTLSFKKNQRIRIDKVDIIIYIDYVFVCLFNIFLIID